MHPSRTLRHRLLFSALLIACCLVDRTALAQTTGNEPAAIAIASEQSAQDTESVQAYHDGPSAPTETAAVTDNATEAASATLAEEPAPLAQTQDDARASVASDTNAPDTNALGRDASGSGSDAVASDTATVAGTDGASRDVSQDPAVAANIANAAPAPGEVYDPWEKFNRRMHRFNNAADRYLLRPVARGYVQTVPQPVRRSLGRLFNNAGAPVTVVNSLLQGKPKEAGQSFGRFLLNSTVGLGGLFDPATKAKIPEHNEDFGQTLARWGWKKSRYLELPLLGPGTVRDVFGNAVDSAVMSGKGPLSPTKSLSSTARMALDAVETIEGRSQLLPFDALREGVPDDYLLIRDFWSQRRQFEIEDRKQSEVAAAIPDYLLQDNATEDAVSPAPKGADSENGRSPRP